jgi:hypothetical protein
VTFPALVPIGIVSRNQRILRMQNSINQVANPAFETPIEGRAGVVEIDQIFRARRRYLSDQLTSPAGTSVRVAHNIIGINKYL